MQLRSAVLEPSALESCEGLPAIQETRRTDQAEGLHSRIARYSRARKRAVGMSDYLQALVTEPVALTACARLKNCGQYLHFRHYYLIGEVRLYAAEFCKQHLICPLCAIRRGVRSLTAYLERYHYLRDQFPQLQPYMITFTVRDGDDLAERFAHLTTAFKRLQERSRNWKRRKRGSCYTQWASVDGAVGSYEIKRGKNSCQWHPHVHLAALCSTPPNQAQLRHEWESITGDSFMVDVRPFHQHQDDADAFMEVMKYAVKFSDLSCEDNWYVARQFRARQLLFSFGCFRGVKIPDALTDDPLNENEQPYFDLFFRYYDGSGYQLTGESPIY